MSFSKLKVQAGNAKCTPIFLLSKYISGGTLWSPDGTGRPILSKGDSKMVKNGVGRLKFFHINQKNNEFSSDPLYRATEKYQTFHHHCIQNLLQLHRLN